MELGGLQQLKVLLGISAFLALLSWDIVVVCKRRDYWIQGKALVLTGLTVQFLGYFDIQNVNVFGQSHSQETELEMLFNKELSIDISRLVFCVFIGYVLPGMAFAGSGGSWMNIAALVVSLSFHMATEVYAIENVNNPRIRNEGSGSFISSTVVLSVGTICLVFYLGCAVLDGNSFRRDLTHKIPQIISENEVDESKMQLRDNTLNLWVLARHWQEEYWLESSFFNPPVGTIVTICVAVVSAKVISHKSLLHDSNLNYNVGLSRVYLQCVFIVIGWIIILWRWFMFLLFVTSEEFHKQNLGGYEGTSRCCRSLFLYMRATLDPMPLYRSAHYKGVPSTLVLIVWKVLRILTSTIVLITTMLPLSFFILHFFFHSFCLELSVHPVHGLRKALKKWGCTYLMCEQAPDLERADGKAGFFIRKVGVFITKSSYDETKRSMEGAYKRGQECKDLIAVIQRRAAVENEVPKIRGPWKMKAVAAISIMVELAYHGDLDEDVKAAINAYKQARDLLEFLDCPDNIAVDPINLIDTCDFRAYQENLEAENKMLKLEKLAEENKLRPPALPLDKVRTVVGVCAGKRAYTDMVQDESSDSRFCKGTQRALRNPHMAFYQDWMGKRTPFYSKFYLANVDEEKRSSMEYVCKALYNRSYKNERELMHLAIICLGDIIAACILQVPEELLKYCKNWAREFKEEKIRKATEMTEKLRAIREKWSPPCIEAETRKREQVIDIDEERRVVRVVKPKSRKRRRKNENCEERERESGSESEIAEVRNGMEVSTSTLV